jgi:hypothetical protein
MFMEAKGRPLYLMDEYLPAATQAQDRASPRPAR